jgi:cellulose synthase/poly-beta-1,6-N-acetylglucosamine synthase-like glycosyltransferase
VDVWLSLLWQVLGTLCTAATLVGSVELLVLTVAGLLPPRRSPAASGTAPRLAVVVPAHDEEAGIAATVASLLACDGAEAQAIAVVAHNCTDRTAEVATRAGARVLVLDDASRRGKAYALDHAFRFLREEGYEACAVIDADTRVDPSFLREVRAAFAAGADAVQVRYSSRPVAEDARARLRRIAFAAMNVLRPRGRARLGVSAGILGNGFALSRATLDRVPYDVCSITEDLAYHVRLVRAGLRVSFLDDVTVWGEMAVGAAASRVQSARWEGGRLGIARAQLPDLLRDLAAGRWRALEPAADLLLLPLGYHALLLLVALAIPCAATRAYAVCGCAVLAGHIAAALRFSGGGARDLRALACAPLYLVWKLALLRSIGRAARRDAAWVRTPRTRG